MKIIYSRKVEKDELPKNASAETHLLCVKVNDIKKCANDLMNIINDTSWITRLKPVAKASYKDTADRTINRLLEIFQKVENTVTTEFGEYMISITSWNSLNKTHGHSLIPIVELWKEKLTGNPGFDFHTESKQNRIAFGEAKYKKGQNPYTDAVDQILKFIALKKDLGDANNLQNFASGEAIDNLVNRNCRGFSVAFSMHSTDYEKIFSNILKKDLIQKLATNCNELYIIGVQT